MSNAVLETNIKEWTVDLVEANEYMSLMLKCLSSEEYKKATEHLSRKEQAAAQWGMAFCSMYAHTHCKHYGGKFIIDNDDIPKGEDDILLYYPCNYCGSCSAWLGAYEPGSPLETHEQLLEECKRRGCDLVGTAVPREELICG